MNDQRMAGLQPEAEWTTLVHRRQLSPREDMVARLIARGFSNKEIAQTLSISMASVKRSVTNVMLQWRCVNRTQVALEALRRGIVQLAAVSAAPPLAPLTHAPPPAAPITAPDAPPPAIAISPERVSPADQ